MEQTTYKKFLKMVLTFLVDCGKLDASKLKRSRDRINGEFNSSTSFTMDKMFVFIKTTDPYGNGSAVEEVKLYKNKDNAMKMVRAQYKDALTNDDVFDHADDTSADGTAFIQYKDDSNIYWYVIEVEGAED